MPAICTAPISTRAVETLNPEPALKFVTTLPHPNDEGNLLLRLRERGFAILRNVFVRESVDAYLEQLRSTIRKGPHWYGPYEVPLDQPIAIHPARAPRLRNTLRGAFAWERERPEISLACPGWLVTPSNPDPRLVHDWHKDGDHWGLGSIDRGYQYPSMLGAAAYLTDMTPDHGPTFVIPRSHRDPGLSPFDAKGCQEEPMLLNKEDVVIWDSRMWHRASSRKVEGMRIMMNFLFFPVPIRDGRPFSRSKAVRQALRESNDPQDRILFGGPLEVE